MPKRPSVMALFAWPRSTCEIAPRVSYDEEARVIHQESAQSRSGHGED